MAVAAAIGSAALLVLQWLAAQPLWLDEEMIAINFRDRSFAELAGPLWLGQSAPHGWLVIQRAVVVTLGTGEMALRLVPMLFGLATLGAAIWIGRRWMNWAGAAVLLVLVTFSRWIAHYPDEVKHYSADAFWALLLPALVVWAIEGQNSPARMRRTIVWWAIAAAAQWSSNGALLVAPACALALLFLMWRRDGFYAALMVTALSGLWLASFALNYDASLRYTHHNEYLRQHWAAEVPPAGLDASGMLSWLGNRVEPLALNPAGTDRWISLWALSLFGFLFAARRSLGLVFGAIPVSAFLFAIPRLVPLHARFSLWIVPAVYVGVALGVDRAARMARNAISRRRWALLLVPGVVAIVTVRLSVDLIEHGVSDIQPTLVARHKHLLDDRAAVRWLLTQRKPDDVLLTTHLGWPALWWYGGSDLSGYEMKYVEGPDCDRNQLRDFLKSHKRVVVYNGFPDVPDGFDDFLLHELDANGEITAFRQFTARGRVVVASPQSGGSDTTHSKLLSESAGRQPVRLDGCVAIAPAARW